MKVIIENPMTVKLFDQVGAVIRLPCSGAVAAFIPRCSSRKELAIPFALRHAKNQQERSVSTFLKLTEL